MKTKNILRLISCSLILLICLPIEMSYAEHPAQSIMALYAGDIKDMKTIEPYTVSILALNELEQGRNADKVKQFILWYFNRLNYPDREGLTGTIYVYTLEGNQEYPTYQYDSVDGYAGLFLYLLQQYVLKTGDNEILTENWDKIEDIAYLIPVLQDMDGLTRALPDSKVKYLMDNCEAYGGITAYLALRKMIGKEDSIYYQQVKHSIQKGILEELYSSGGKIFAWAVENNTVSRSSWMRYYPDAYAQLFLINYDLLIDKPVLRDQLWRNFYGRYAPKRQMFPIEQRIIYDLTKSKMEGILQDGSKRHI